MQQNVPFCVLLKKDQFFATPLPHPPPPPTAFSLSRVGIHAMLFSSIIDVHWHNILPFNGMCSFNV